jgi:regulatory protein
VTFRPSTGSGPRSTGQKANRARGRSEKAAEPLTARKLEELAVSYLNRFDCTVHKLKQHLRDRVRKLGGSAEADMWIAAIIERYKGSGMLDDARFAKNFASQLASRGKSARAISQKLSGRGVPSEVAGELMATRKQDDPGAELEAARAYVRKRRLGPHRTPEKREEYRHKDLASLARQGFSFDIAKQALAVDATSDDEF